MTFPFKNSIETFWHRVIPVPSPSEVPAIPDRVADLYFGPEGKRRYYLSRPSGTPKALIVMLHGCTQTARDFIRSTGMEALAKDAGVAVLWPEQSRRANVMRCWNWFEPDLSGENALLFALIDEAREKYGLGDLPVSIAGLSAGGSMAVAMAAERPETFKALGVHSGAVPGACENAQDAFTVMRNGSGEAFSDKLPPMILFHGTEDHTVVPQNGAELADAIRGPVTTGETEGYGWSRQVSKRGEYWQVDGMGHAWSGAPVNRPHADPQGPDASAEMLRFFLNESQKG